MTQHQPSQGYVLHLPDAQDKSQYDCHATFLMSPTCLTGIINKENSQLLPTFGNLLKVCTGRGLMHPESIQGCHWPAYWT